MPESACQSPCVRDSPTAINISRFKNNNKSTFYRTYTSDFTENLQEKYSKY